MSAGQRVCIVVSLSICVAFCIATVTLIGYDIYVKADKCGNITTLAESWEFLQDDTETRNAIGYYIFTLILAIVVLMIYVCICCVVACDDAFKRRYNPLWISGFILCAATLVCTWWVPYRVVLLVRAVCTGTVELYSLSYRFSITLSVMAVVMYIISMIVKWCAVPETRTSVYDQLNG